MLDIISYPESTKSPSWLGSKKNFRNGGSQIAGKCHFEIGFANTAFHKRAKLLIFYAEYTESVFAILSHPESAMGPP